MISTAIPELEASGEDLHDGLERFAEFGGKTARVTKALAESRSLPVYENEFWTSKQRAASRLHEISYRACFKPQLPRFFIERLTKPGDVVFDPFMGRGTTLLEAALLGRIPVGSDANPLCQ
jgi:DNA modification methylase